MRRLPHRVAFRWGVPQALALSMGLVITLLMGVTSVLQIRQERAAGYEKLRDEGLNLAYGLHDLAADLLYASDVDRLRDIAPVLTRQDDIQYVRISRPDGRVVVDTDQPKSVPRMAVADAVVSDVVDPSEAVRPAVDTFEVSAPLRAGDQALGTIYVGINTSSVEPGVRDAILREIMQSFTLIVIGVGISVLLGLYIVRPIKRLATATQSIAEGEFLSSGLGGRTDEIGDLARGFDEMSHALKLSHEELERRVEQRTALLRASEGRARQLARQMVGLQESERRNIARELHDELGQELTGLRFRLEAVRGRSDQEARSILDEGIKLMEGLTKKVRDLSVALRPTMLDDLGLLPALNSLVRRLGDQTGIRVDLKHDGLNGHLPADAETAAYRTVQEGLTNVARHASTDHASLSVTIRGEAIEILIEDHGVGFDPDMALTSVKTTGLANMRERLELLGGELSVESVQGEGSRLRAQIPLEDRAEEK